MIEVKENRMFIAVLFIFSFILLKEWLVIITDLTDTGYLFIFLLFIIVSFLLALLNIKWQMSIVIKLLYIAWAVQVIFLEKKWLSLDIFPFLFRILQTDISLLMKGQFFDLSNPTRTIGFFLFIWLLVYLVRYWVIVKNQIFLFYFTTVILIATADTFSPYSADGSIFLNMIVGLLLLGALHAFKLEKTYAHVFSITRLLNAFIPLVLILMISSLFVSFLPKFAPIWPDPVPFIQEVFGEGSGTGGGGSGPAKSGYDPNDSQLGGPFLEDPSLVFEAKVKKKQYWKIEVKDYYTSKGWEQSMEDAEPRRIDLGEVLVEQPTDEETDEEENQLASLSMVEKFPFIIYPYGLQTIDSGHEVVLIYNRFLQQFTSEMNEAPFPLDFYDLSFKEDRFSLKQLRETSMDDLRALVEMEHYLQLPESLPDRIGELAQSITESSDNVYDKAKAIERYFSRSGFQYERVDVAIPEEDEDYVDQFLFDTKKGYCDNFSSSMVVMLRTIGIPARWVKGFAPGELKENEEGEQVYRISNNEAHSWVEAYMPNVGWVPFEPTIGFSGVTNIDYDIELSLDDPEVREMPEEQREEFEREQEEEKTEKEQTAAAKGQTSLFGMSNRIVLGIGVLIGLVAAIGYATRRKWLPIIHVRLYQLKNEEWDRFVPLYFKLLKQLERIGLKRQEHETLQTFAKRVDEHFGNSHMEQLTKVYEKGFYANASTISNWEHVNELWKDIMLRTLD